MAAVSRSCATGSARPSSARSSRPIRPAHWHSSAPRCDARAGALFLDVPTRWRELAAALEARGFVRQRPFARMALGGEPFACGDRLFALAGPEFG